MRALNRLRQRAYRHLGISLLDCGGPHCRRFALAHSRLRKDGIFLDQTWLCSVHCLQAAVAKRLAVPRSAAPYAMPRVPYRLILVQQGLLSQDGLRSAAVYARERGIPLDRALLVLDLVSEQALCAARAAEGGCAFYTLPPVAIPAAFVLPASLAARYEAAAVHATRSRVLLGFVHRIDSSLLAAFEQATGTPAEGCLVTETHWRTQLALVPAATQAAVERCRDRAEAVRRVCEHAVHAGAEQVRLGQLGSVIWVRMQSDHEQRIDRLLELGELVPLGACAQPGATTQRVRRRG